MRDGPPEILKKSFRHGEFNPYRIIFIPRRDCESSTEGGPIVFTYVLILGRKRILDFQNPKIPSAFLRP